MLKVRLSDLKKIHILFRLFNFLIHPTRVNPPKGA